MLRQVVSVRYSVRFRSADLFVLRCLVKVAVGPKRSTNRNFKQIITIECGHLKIEKERAYTMIYHEMDLFLSRSNYVSNNMA